MKHWLKLALLLNTIGGGFAGLLSLLPLWARAPGDVANYLLLAAMSCLFAFGIYSGWRLSQDEVAGLRWAKRFLFLQLPYVSSSLLGYELLSAFAFRLSFGFLAGGNVTLTTEPYLGSVAWLSLAQGAPLGLGANLVALFLIILVSRAQRAGHATSVVA